MLLTLMMNLNMFGPPTPPVTTTVPDFIVGDEGAGGKKHDIKVEQFKDREKLLKDELKRLDQDDEDAIIFTTQWLINLN